MCGIVGLINLRERSVDQDILTGMTNTLTHRGPDDSGTYVHENVGIGHRRLSIIDLDSGHQPMANENKSIWITYNGEIYNYLKLKEILSAKGYRFLTKSDTEVIIHAYEEWGDKCVEHFRGMFSFAIVDYTKRRVFLAVDHLGIKPLYFFLDKDRFAFSSEIQAFHKIKDLQLEIDTLSIDEYLFFHYIPAPKTIYKQIYKLLPAHRMSVSFTGELKEPEEYWQLKFKPNTQLSHGQWAEALDEVLYDSVKAHLVADVPFGAFLSGGVDSSTVVAYMSQILKTPVRTFNIGFDDPDYNESVYAQEVAKIFETDHHSQVVHPDAIGILPQLVKHFGEPFGDSSAIPTYYVSQLARKSVPMVLSGDGGDEAFYGYRRHRAWYRWITYDRYPLLKHLFPFMQKVLPGGLQRRPTLKNWHKFGTYLKRGSRMNLWRTDYRHLFDYRNEHLENLFSQTSNFSVYAKAQFMDIKTYLPFDILSKVDRSSMIHSLEVRTPLTDYKVMEFAATIPHSFNFNKNDQRKWEGKVLLRKNLAKHLPEKLINRPKRGFAVPLTKWFKKGSDYRVQIEARLLDKESKIIQYFEPKAIKNVLNMRAKAGRPLWSLLVLEEWLKQNT